MNSEFPQLLRAGEDSHKSGYAIAWGINLLRRQNGVIPPLEVVGMEFASEADRAAFLVEAIAIELRRQRLLAFLSRTEHAWKDEDRPGIAAVGTAAWVHNLRHEKSVRPGDRDDELDP